MEIARTEILDGTTRRMVADDSRSRHGSAILTKKPYRSRAGLSKNTLDIRIQAKHFKSRDIDC